MFILTRQCTGELMEHKYPAGVLVDPRDRIEKSVLMTLYYD